jgi:CheY-like chemotaxis protein
MSILVVDDEEVILELTELILGRAGYKVITAESGFAGVETFRAHADSVKLVLLDLTMEDLSGVETLRRIRKVCPHVPCILSSGSAPDPDDIPDDLAANLYFLQKPYRAEHLAALVSHIVAGDTEKTTADRPSGG